MKKKYSRRSFLSRASLATVNLAMFSSWRSISAQNVPALRVDSGVQGVQVPEYFVGLSYENMQLEDDTFFSPDNKSLVEQFRAIAPRGVLRLGGNTSEFGWWKENSNDPEPQRRKNPWKRDGEPVNATVFAITPRAIRNLDGFLRATGWKCIYGLNLGYGTPESDLPEARFVFETLGPRLEYFQIGNEVDLFKGHLRNPQTWNVETYLDEWLTIARAVQKMLPAAKFGLPDVASDISWLTKIGQRWPTIADTPKVVTLSHHYYWEGPPSNPKVTAENLLQPSGRVVSEAALARDAAKMVGSQVRYRMTEGNTVYRGGKDGVSDVFASALWSADYLLKMMNLGYSGVNLHGGSGHAQAVSVGGAFFGEEMMKDPTVPHPKPFYTPIANEGTLAGAGVRGELNSIYLLEPVGYGMKFAAAFAGATMLPVTVDVGAVNATVYAAKREDGKTIVAMVNKDLNHPLKLSVDRVSLLLDLSAPTIDSRSASLREIKPGKKRFRGQVVVPAHTAQLFLLD